MRSERAVQRERLPPRRQFSLRGLLRATSLVCVLSAVPGFWPAVLALAVVIFAFMLPGVSILAGLMLAQFVVYTGCKRLVSVRCHASAGEGGYFQSQMIERR